MTLADSLLEIARGTPLEERLSGRGGESLLLHASAQHELMVRWNRVHNLTRVKDEAEAARRHWADCLLAGLTVEAALGHPDRVMDIGSGAGFPGVCWALLWPGCEVTLVEPSRKRCSFLRRVRQELGLQQLVILEKRSDDLTLETSADTASGHQHLVTTRATLPPARLPELASLVRPGGAFAGLVGETKEEDWTRDARNAGLIEAQVLSYEVPGLAHRAVVLARRAG